MSDSIQEVKLSPELLEKICESVVKIEKDGQNIGNTENERAEQMYKEIKNILIKEVKK